VVVARPEHHRQTYATPYSPAFAAEIQVPLTTLPPLPLDARKIIARRCALELPVDGVVNLGIGMPEGVAAVANEEGVLDLITLTAEPGIVGGVPAGGLDFGAGYNVEAVIDQNQQFDFYDGGGLDMACLGMAECDREGNVNVSRFGSRLSGAGGFINISQTARRLVLAGTFTSGGLEVQVHDGQLSIVREGRARKFHAAVEQVTFSGRRAAQLGQPVLYVTERCVFELGLHGLRLVEVAPGIDIERDILAHMAFRPLIDAVRPMAAALFAPATMGLRQRLLDIPLDERIHHDAERGILFLNFRHLHVRTEADVERIRSAVTRQAEAIGHRVVGVVNYDGFRLDDAVAGPYAAMVQQLEQRHYTRVMRFAGGAFERMKLAQAIHREIGPAVLGAGMGAAGSPG